MAGFEAFDREIRLATEGLEPEAINAALAKFARQELAKAISQGASPVYDLYVNGRPARSENEVVAPGPIVYEFALLEPVISFALERLRSRAPVKSGRFRNSFIVIADQKLVTNFDTIRPGAEVIITNFQPYIRKAEGGQLGTKRFAIFDGTKRDLARQFGNDRRNTPGIYSFETRWLNISSGLHPEIPYILKGGEKLRAPAQNARSSAFRAGRLSLSRRKDREVGQPITYPSVVMSMVL